MPESLAAAALAPRVLLVDPYMSRSDPMERKFVELYPSLGLLTLGAYLRSNGVEVSMVDLTFARDLTSLTRALRTRPPHLVGVHTKTLTFERSVEIAQKAHEAGAFAIAGGPDSATRIETYLDAGFDAVVPAEGEVTLLELARQLASGRGFGAVPGVVARTEGKSVRGAHRPFLKDLDLLPLPAWDLVDMDRYLGEWEKRTGERRAAVLTSRGCPFDCSWCSKPTFGRTFRQQSPARVVEELRALKERFHVTYVRFCDDVFGISRPWIDELTDRLSDADLGLQFECLARVDLLKPDLLHQLREVGLARVYVGVESGSQKMLDLMNRGTKLHQVERTAQALRDEGIRQFWFLMLGYPGETVEDIEATLQLFRRFSPEEYSVSIAVPIPGTRFHQTVKDRLLGRKRSPTRGSGGRTLLYEATYPQNLYRWEQARFGLDAALGRARDRISPELATHVVRVADGFHERVARPLLIGKNPGRTH
ncbi:MAG: B12-binding domain-containing radical SAM protein [Thermoplasmata archaeon]|nr:B12-binding domain-containing radical SAM protein [Thermoplasmata archaeon]